MKRTVLLFVSLAVLQACGEGESQEQPNSVSLELVVDPRGPLPLDGGLTAPSPDIRRRSRPVTSAGPNGEEPTLTVFPDQVNFEAPDSVLLYAFLSVGEGAKIFRQRGRNADPGDALEQC